MPNLIIEIREGPAASTHPMASCEIPNVNKVNPVPYCIVPYRTIALNLSTRQGEIIHIKIRHLIYNVLYILFMCDLNNVS